MMGSGASSIASLFAHSACMHVERANKKDADLRGICAIIMLSIFAATSLFPGWAMQSANAEYAEISTAQISNQAAQKSDFANDVLVSPMIVVGDPDGAPAVTTADRIDPNTAFSSFAGVVSINPITTSGSSYIGSGAVISPYHILTAGHCVDTNHDGAVDLDLDATRVFFNVGGSPSLTVTGIASIDLHPDFTGFNNPVTNDDIAIITLKDPIPTGVPIYAISRDPYEYIELITMVGYGTTGDGVNGFQADSANFFTKRTGQNVASVYEDDLADEGTDAREVFLYDFDGPDTSTDIYGDGGTLGNIFETTIGGGDSGSPSFLWNDDGDDVVQADELVIFGVNTFSASYVGEPAAPLFGSAGGGMVVSSYAGFIDGVVPEPATLGLLVIGGLALLKRRRR